jgi:hypothetical protein
MADNFAHWYTGGMTPPLALPGGGYIPAPLSTPQMSVDQMYQGIYAPPAVPQSLQTRPVQTVQINPQTGMPYSTSMSATAQGGFGQGGNIAARGRTQLPMTASANAALGAIGRATGSMYATAPNQPAGSINAFKAQDRLPALPAGLPLGSGPQASARGSLGASASGGGRMAFNAPSMPPPASTDVIRLTFDPMSETSGQNMANSAGRPVAGPSGKTYYPTNQATDKIRAPMSPVAERATQKPTGLFGGLFGGTGGLFGGGMFGGGQQAPRNAAGLPIAAASGPVINGATYGITATGSVGDYGSSPGQITAGLQPGERKYDASTNSWGLR